MQKPKQKSRRDEPKRTERQRAADARRRQERHAAGNVRTSGPKTPEKRMAPRAPGEVSSSMSSPGRSPSFSSSTVRPTFS